MKEEEIAEFHPFFQIQKPPNVILFPTLSPHGGAPERERPVAAKRRGGITPFETGQKRVRRICFDFRGPERIQP